MKKVKISNNVIRRLPRYIRQLDKVSSLGVTKISSAEISRQTGFTASQIRQDFNCFGGFGQQGYGYNTDELRRRLANILGMTENHTAIIIGIGNLGHALIENFHFSSYGFTILAAFDVAEALVGTTLSGTPVYHSDELESYLSSHAVDMAILTLPGSLANQMAARLSDLGILGIWNFTNEEITSVSEHTIVENVHFSDSLLALSYYLTEAKQTGLTVTDSITLE